VGFNDQSDGDDGTQKDEGNTGHTRRKNREQSLHRRNIAVAVSAR